jgi:hypothetical protein
LSTASLSSPICFSWLRRGWVTSEWERASMAED